MKLEELKLEVDYFEFDEDLYERLNSTPLKNPKLISYNKKACDLIGLDYKECKREKFLDFMNGNLLLNGSKPYSMVYAGHQFGYFVPQLGDGRAINLGSINKWHLQTKGSGLTRYSRMGDGKAVLRSSIREYIISEAMNTLGIPTTRALAIIGSDSFAHRNWEEESCAIVMRMAESWVRIGTFEFFAKTQNSKKNLEQLSNYVIKQSYSHLENEKNKYEKFFYEVVDKSALLLAKWQAYGFMHGVMNSDNFSTSGLTIDYGPFAFMDIFEKSCICNHTDVEGRYSYENQPYIARWNLQILAKALGHICDENLLKEYLETYTSQFESLYLELMSKRIGLDFSKSSDNNLNLILELLESLEIAQVDYNLFFYKLTKLKSFENINSILNFASYPQALRNWFVKYQEVCKKQGSNFKERHQFMKKVNPKFIIKNYMLQEAIEKADNEDYTLVNELLKIAQNPFLEHKGFERYAQATPKKLSNLRLSCSS